MPWLCLLSVWGDGDSVWGRFDRASLLVGLDLEADRSKGMRSLGGIDKSWPRRSLDMSPDKSWLRRSLVMSPDKSWLRRCLSMVSQAAL